MHELTNEFYALITIVGSSENNWNNINLFFLQLIRSIYYTYKRLHLGENALKLLLNWKKESKKLASNEHWMIKKKHLFKVFTSGGKVSVCIHLFIFILSLTDRLHGQGRRMAPMIGREWWYEIKPVQCTSYETIPWVFFVIVYIINAMWND